MAIGAFAPTDYAALRARMIIRTPAPRPLAPVAPSPPPNRIPLPTTAPGDPIIKMPTFIPPILVAAPSAPSAPPPSSGGGTSGTVTDPGSTGGSSNDTALLLNALGSLFKSQDVGQSMAPVSFAPTGTETSATTADGGGSSMGAIIFLVVLVAGGAYWYTHRAAA